MITTFVGYNGISRELGQGTREECIQARNRFLKLREKSMRGGAGFVDKTNPWCWELQDNDFAIGDFDGWIRIES